MADINSMPARERILELLSYDPDTGRLTWRRRANNNGAPEGSEAGNISKSLGYRFVGVCGKNILAHRLIWFMVHGTVPAVVDHINRDKSDNRLCNLRAADKRLNAFNVKMLSTNTSGYRGVSIERSTGKWVARINDGTAYRMIGRYTSKEDAYEAYRAEALKVAGEFASWMSPQSKTMTV